MDTAPRRDLRGFVKLQFIVPINCNTAIVKYASRVKYLRREIRFACEILPSVGCRSILQMAETLRVSILIKMDKTEGFAPQLARKGEFHTQSVFHMRVSAYFTREAHFTWV